MAFMKALPMPFIFSEYASISALNPGTSSSEGQSWLPSSRSVLGSGGSG